MRSAEWLKRSTGGLVARQDGRIRVLDLRNVSWVEAERDYVRFHLLKESVLIRKTLAAAEQELAGRRFLRIHRSAIVNLDFIVEMRPVAGGDCRVLLRGGTILTLSRSFRRRAVHSGIMYGQPYDRPKAAGIDQLRADPGADP